MNRFLKAIEHCYGNKTKTAEEAFSDMERQIAKGYYTVEDATPLKDKIFPPDVDEESNILSVKEFSLPDPNLTLEERITQLELLELEREGLI